MPLYEYQCEKCGHRFEEIQRVSDPPADRCPSCGAGAVRKLMSSPAIQFKGSGWYITDYARKDQAAAKAAKGDAKETQDSKGGSETRDAGESKAGAPGKDSGGESGKDSRGAKPASAEKSGTGKKATEKGSSETPP